jgi:hypothetical protein
MPAARGNQDRRILQRFADLDLEVDLRQRGRLGRTPASVLDFNRFGIAVLVAAPLAKEKQIFLTLSCGEIRLDNVVGVVHNCIAQGDGFRCGIQFRTRSDLQFDKDQVEHDLLALENSLDRASQPPYDAASNEAPNSAAH